MKFYQLAVLNKPVVKCKAEHNSSAAKKASEEDADGSEKEIFLAEEAHVMLRSSLRSVMIAFLSFQLAWGVPGGREVAASSHICDW